MADLVTPLISAIGGQPNFASLTFTIGKSTFSYGLFLNALISFIILAAVVYFLIVLPVNKLLAASARKKAATQRDCPECLSKIPIDASRCMYCTSAVPPVAPAAEPAS